MKRILIRTPNWIGDQVLAYPFYRLLRNAYPDAWIGVVCTEWVRDIQFKGLIDEVFVIPKKKGDSYLQAFKTIRQFARRLKQSGPWDLGIALPNSFGAALLLYMAGVKERRGYNTDARGWLLTQKVEWSSHPNIHRSQAYVNLLTHEGIPEYDIRDYWIESGDKNFDPIKYWPDIIPIDPPRESYFLLAPGATADSRRWSVDQFSDLIEKIHDRYGYKGIIVGGNAEREIANQFLKRGLPIEDYTGKGWVSAHWKLFRQAQFTICNESGLAHVASLCGSKVHIVCGAADPKRTQPIGPGKVQVSINPVECWPCERNVCRFEDERKNQCLKGIFPDRVLEEIEVGFFSRS
jgi:heptosyltransferase-2